METYWSLSASASRSACFSTASSFGEMWVAAPCVCGSDAERPLRAPAATAPVFAPSLPEGRGDDAALLGQQRRQQVLGRDLGVVALLRLRLGGGQGLLGLDGELVQSHA